MSNQLLNALGIDPSQVNTVKKKQSKKTDDSLKTKIARNAMDKVYKSKSKLLQVNHYKLNTKTKMYDYKTSIIQGNICDHPTKEGIKIVERLHIYKERIETTEEEIQVLNK